MQSEFYNVALDRLRYSLVWEDSNTLYEGLDIQPDDRLLVISSAGCNVFNSLLKAPRQVIAIDLNPVQNKLVLFKKHVIQHHDHAVLRALLGLDGQEKVARAYQHVEKTLPIDTQCYWASFFASHPGGILTAGKLEAYITGFYSTLDAQTQQKLNQLLLIDDVARQRDFFMAQLDASPFREQFIDYFDDANLSKGRDPKLFTYAQESGGVAFYNRLLKQVTTTLVNHNFFFCFFFFGPTQLPESMLPPCYQSQNYALLRSQLDRLTLVDGEAVDYLLSADGRSITKASLSNIFEYTSQEEFRQVCVSLLSGQDRQLRFVFWNLLQEQGHLPDSPDWTETLLSDHITQDNACFYFRDVRVLATQPILAKAVN